jgi:hypothetical protein
MLEVVEQEMVEQQKQRKKRLIWGVLIGSVIMALAFFGPILYYLLSPPSWPSGDTVSPFLLCGGMIIAGIVAGAIMRDRIWNVLAGVLCAIPATVVCSLCLLYLAEHPIHGIYIDVIIVDPVEFLIMVGLGAIGGLISYGIQSLKRLAK